MGGYSPEARLRSLRSRIARIAELEGKTVAELAQEYDYDLCRIPNFGVKSLAVLRADYPAKHVDIRPPREVTLRDVDERLHRIEVLLARLVERDYGRQADGSEAGRVVSTGAPVGDGWLPSAGDNG